MENFTIIALDPGGTTGWARFTAERVDGEYFGEQYECGQLGPGGHHEELETLLGLSRLQDSTVVCESFEYRNRSRPGLELISVEYIGVTRLWCSKNKVPLVMQTASMGKVTHTTFVKPANLERLGLWQGTKYKHAMDGYGHLLYYMIHNNIQKQRLLTQGWRGPAGNNK